MRCNFDLALPWTIKTTKQVQLKWWSLKMADRIPTAVILAFSFTLVTVTFLKPRNRTPNLCLFFKIIIKLDYCIQMNKGVVTPWTWRPQNYVMISQQSFTCWTGGRGMPRTVAAILLKVPAILPNKLLMNIAMELTYVQTYRLKSRNTQFHA